MRVEVFARSTQSIITQMYTCAGGGTAGRFGSAVELLAIFVADELVCKTITMHCICFPGRLNPLGKNKRVSPLSPLSPTTSNQSFCTTLRKQTMIGLTKITDRNASVACPSRLWMEFSCSQREELRCVGQG